MRSLVACTFAILTLPTHAIAADPLSWGAVVTRTANGCDAFTPVRGPDGHHYTSFGDCGGLTGKLAKLSMGFGRIVGGPADARVQDLPTAPIEGSGLVDFGNRDAGRKPSSAIIVGKRMYVWVRNYGPNGTQARLKYSDNFTRHRIAIGRGRRLSSPISAIPYSFKARQGTMYISSPTTVIPPTCRPTALSYCASRRSRLTERSAYRVLQRLTDQSGLGEDLYEPQGDLLGAREMLPVRHFLQQGTRPLLLVAEERRQPSQQQLRGLVGSEPLGPVAARLRYRQLGHERRRARRVPRGMDGVGADQPAGHALSSVLGRGPADHPQGNHCRRLLRPTAVPGIGPQRCARVSVS